MPKWCKQTQPNQFYLCYCTSDAWHRVTSLHRYIESRQSAFTSPHTYATNACAWIWWGTITQGRRSRLTGDLIHTRRVKSQHMHIFSYKQKFNRSIASAHAEERRERKNSSNTAKWERRKKDKHRYLYDYYYVEWLALAMVWVPARWYI